VLLVVEVSNERREQLAQRGVDLDQAGVLRAVDVGHDFGELDHERERLAQVPVMPFHDQLEERSARQLAGIDARRIASFGEVLLQIAREPFDGDALLGTRFGDTELAPATEVDAVAPEHECGRGMLEDEASDGGLWVQHGRTWSTPRAKAI